MPERIQLRRTKGWRMPADTVKVSRPSEFGNQFVVGKDGTPSQVVSMYRRYFVEPSLRVHGSAYFEPLRGKNLACWCAIGSPCHADVLLEIANRPICQPVEDQPHG